MKGGTPTSAENNETSITNQPKAYLNWILLDDQFNYVNTYPQSGAIPVANFTAGTLGTPGYSGIPITKSGYLYIWVSNESQNWNVFFDNLAVQQRSGPITEETHYYPFGLTIAGISSRAPSSLENRRKFNDGTELNTDLDLNWYETDYRSYDPQIGRFHQIDELTEFDFNWSPYVYAHNNPILLNDPLGLTADSTGTPGFSPDNPKILPEVVVTATRNKSVGQPGLAESLIPIWGSGRAAVDDFQNGRWGWGIFNTVMAISDVFLVKSAITAIGKLAVKGIGELTAKEGVYIIKTESAHYIGQSKNMAKRLIQHLKKGGKLSEETLEKVLGHEMSCSTKVEREIYEQYLITKYGGTQGGQLLNKVNPMGGRMQEYAEKLEEVITKYNLPR